MFTNKFKDELVSNWKGEEGDDCIPFYGSHSFKWKPLYGQHMKPIEITEQTIFQSSKFVH